jgi:hypothetical protein
MDEQDVALALLGDAERPEVDDLGATTYPTASRMARVTRTATALPLSCWTTGTISIIRLAGFEPRDLAPHARSMQGHE